MRTAQFIEETKASKDELPEKPENTNKIRKKRTLPDAAKPFQFKPGVSGNPGGRPKGDQFKQLAKHVIENMSPAEFEEAASGFRKQLFKGNAYAFNVLSDRGYGKLTEKVDLTVQEGIVERLTAARKRAGK